MWTLRSATQPRVHASRRPEPEPWISIMPPRRVPIGGDTPSASARTMAWYCASSMIPCSSPRSAWTGFGYDSTNAR